MDLVGQTAPGASESLIRESCCWGRFPFSRHPQKSRAGSSGVLVSPGSWWSVSVRTIAKILSHVPSSDHLCRSCAVFHLPKRAGRSRHGTRCAAGGEQITRQRASVTLTGALGQRAAFPERAASSAGSTASCHRILTTPSPAHTHSGRPRPAASRSTDPGGDTVVDVKAARPVDVLVVVCGIPTPAGELALRHLLGGHERFCFEGLGACCSRPCRRRDADALIAGAVLICEGQRFQRVLQRHREDVPRRAQRFQSRRSRLRARGGQQGGHRQSRRCCSHCCVHGLA